MSKESPKDDPRLRTDDGSFYALGVSHQLNPNWKR